MKSVEFCYWLQGLFELGDPKELSGAQTELIKKHLNMVFIHEIDKSYPEEEQEALYAAHKFQSPDSHAPGSSIKQEGVVMRC